MSFDGYFSMSCNSVSRLNMVFSADIYGLGIGHSASLQTDSEETTTPLIPLGSMCSRGEYLVEKRQKKIAE